MELNWLIGDRTIAAHLNVGKHRAPAENKLIDSK